MILKHNVSEKNEKEWKKEKRRFSFQQDDKGERCAHVYALSKLEIKKNYFSISRKSYSYQ
jgi:hypothetical protein